MILYIFSNEKLNYIEGFCTTMKPIRIPPPRLQPCLNPPTTTKTEPPSPANYWTPQLQMGTKVLISHLTLNNFKKKNHHSNIPK